MAVVAWNGHAASFGAGTPGQPGMADLASDAESFEAFLPREPHGVALGFVSPLAQATPTPPPPPTPTPNPRDPGVGCHRWRYALRWEQPSRLAILKNVLGNSVTTYTDFKAPGAGNQNDWPDPILHSEIAGAWKYTSPSQPTVGSYNHDCGSGGVVCKPPSPTDPEGEQPVGIYYSKGTWDWPDPNSNNLASNYDPAFPPIYHPGVDTTGSRIYSDAAFPPAVFTPLAYGTAGNYDGWAWTLDYGYGIAPINDVVFGPDPGPPLGLNGLVPALMDERIDALSGDSIPGTTGTPLSFPTTWRTRGPGPGLVIGIQTQTNKEFDTQTPPNPIVIRFGGVNQPSWTKNLPRDVVGNTKDVVNWGLMTYSGVPGTPIYNSLVGITTIDTGSGDVSLIEGYMKHRFLGGLGVISGTPTSGAISAADAAMTSTWDVDPRKACNRAYGVILCTDGQSNATNTGSPVDTFWDATTTPCAPDKAGTAFVNFPPGAAEAMYLHAHWAGAGDAIVRTRTFAIGISSDVSRCELNRIAYRGRTDANAKKKDAGFVLYDTTDPVVLRGDVRLPHINPAPETTGNAIPTDESGPGAPNGGINRFDPDQTPLPATAGKDYAFFASDGKALYNAFLAIVRSSASGDYTTSSPVSGAAVSLGNTVVLTSATYPLWEGHIKAKDVTNPLAIVDLWDAGAVLTTPSQPWHPNPDGTAGHPKRQLFTWDPTTGALIEIIAANAGTIDALCGGCGITTAGPAQVPPLGAGSVIDFMRGNDGTETSTPRGWLLGPSINVTPAVVGAAQSYFQSGNVVDHKSFEATYATRRPLAWLGADDGFLHAFDLGDSVHPGDGTEVIGLLPPNLIASQITLYNNYLDPDPSISTETGQNAGFLFDEHSWGIASSLRFADVWFPGATSYKTVGFLTEGPGGDVIAAIDITHPYPGRALSAPALAADQNYDSANPVKILWTKNSSDYPGLFGSWSVPAVAADTFSTSKMTFGAGINPLSLYTSPQNADTFVVDPVDGTLLSTTVTAPLASAATTTVVGHQTFVDSIFLQTNVPGFQNDNLANLSLQGDENGRVNAVFGVFTAPTSRVLIDLNAAAGGPQPLYYSPAANGIGTLGYQAYVLGSGSFYETSPTVSGWNVNRAPATDPPLGSGYNPADPGYTVTPPPFVPRLFIATNPKKITDPLFGTTPLGSTGPPDMSSFVINKVIGGTAVGCPVDGDNSVTLGICLLPSNPTFVAGVHERLGIHSQLTSSPLLVANATGPKQTVFFTVFDPDFGCNGFSYVIKQEFNIAAGGLPVPSFVPNAAGCASTVPPSCGTTVYAAGPGASSGFVVTEKGAFVGQSGVGKNAASLVKVDIPAPSLPGSPNFVPVWWKEQK